MMPWLTSRALIAPLALFLAGSTMSHAPESVGANDNRHSAGTLKNGVLTVALEARNGVWHPEGNGGRGLEVAAFAEVGKAPSTPGPLIRVPVGTEVRATIRNQLDKPLVVFGFGKTRGMSDSTVVPANGSSDVRFTATTAGTFYYMARRGMDPLGLRLTNDLQLHGAIVVDPPNAKVVNDRVFVISWFTTIDPKSKSGIDRTTMAINGLSWPHTEKLDYAQGDSVHWRVVNMTELDHPMHLHGFYFRMDAKGDGVNDSLYTADQKRMAVTEIIPPFTTMALEWKADRPGNWIYHCHYATHLSGLVALDTDMGDHDMSMESKHPSDRPHQMYGLVMGIRVAPNKSAVVQAGDQSARKIRIIQREKANVYGSQPGMSFVVDGQTQGADAMPVPGPALILERGKPVAVTVVNQGKQPAAVHWHGIELESYPDGVPGWSGSGTNILPAIAPRDSLTVRWTPPRAGSFMYHSHFNESMQMGSGLYGPIIVLDPGEKWNSETDKVLFFGTAGTSTNPVFGPFPNIIMNGKTQPDAMNLKVGTKYRFRLFDLAGDTPTLVSINSGETPITWRAVAKDGYPLPASQATPRPAVLFFDPGEIYDFEYTPTTPGELVLKFGPPPPPPNQPPPPANLPFQPPPPTISVAIHVR